MRNTRKLLVALVLVISILMTMAMAVIPASAANMTGGEKLYLVPSANWNQSNARFAAYFFGTGEAWASMTKVEGQSNLYEVTVPAGNWTNVIFCRMNPSASANNWNNKWNQTSDLTYNGTSNCYTVKEGTWDKGGGTWSTYGSSCTHANVGSEATCTTAQVCTDCGDPVVDALGHTYNSSNLCTRCNEQATFTVAGDGAHLGTEWDTGNTANDMSYADGVYTKVYTNVAAGSYKFKVVRDHDWGTAYPNDDKAYSVATAGSTVTITLKGTTVDVKVEAPHVHNFVEGKCECGEEDPNYVPPHVHNFVEGKCECGEEDPNYVPPHEHNFVEGKCECGESDPNYVPPHVNALVVGDTNKIVITGETLNAYGFPIEWVVFTAEEKANYAFAGEGATIAIFDLESNLLCGYTGAADLEAGTYLICIGASFTGEYNVAVTKSEIVPPHEHNFVEGKCECGEVDPDYVAPEVPAANDKLINFSEWEPFAKETYADGDVVKHNDYFTFIYGKNSRVDSSEKTWDDFSGTLRFSLGGKTNSGVPTKNAIQITVDGAHTLKIWYVAGGDARYFELRDADGNAIATTTAETVKNAQYYSELEIPAAGVYYLTIPADNNYIFQLELVAKAVEEPIDPPHVNSLVVGDTNKIVVNGEILNQYNLPIEWVPFVADEKAHYEFVGDNGALAFIFTADGTTLLCGGTGKADLEAGTYLICVGNGLVGEFNVAVTKSEIVIPEPPADDKWTFWISSTDYYTVDGYNIKYNGAGNTYACVGTADVVSLAVGNNTFVITITNNGSAAARVRVDIQATNTIGNHAVCNTNAVGGDVWTDSEWGGSIVTVPAGESVTLTITYDENTERGAVANLVIFVDAMRGDGEMYSADITLSDMAFSYVSDEPIVEPETPKLALGDNTVVIDGSEVNLTGQAIAWLELVVTNAGTYKVSSADLNCFICTEKDFYTNLCGWTGIADLEPGTYYVAVGNSGVTGEFVVTLEADVEAPSVNTLVVGDNKYVINQALKDIGYEFLYFTADKDGIYTFSGVQGCWFFIWPDYPNEYTVAENAIFVSNIDPLTAEFVDSVEVELSAGCFYLVGFKFVVPDLGVDTPVGEYDITVSYAEKQPAHEHNFVEGKCECGEEDPNYIPPVVDPEPETPSEQPEVQLNFFQKIVKAITDFFANIGNWFKNLFAKK